MLLLFLIASVLAGRFSAQEITTNNFHFRVEAGARTCFYERGRAGQMMEVYYQVLNGQHGDLDISVDVIDPTGTNVVKDYKKPHNAIIKDLTVDGDYAFCLDNSYSSFNSKLVFVYVTMETQESDEAVVTVVDIDGREVEVATLTWMFTDENAQPYYLEVEEMAKSLTRTLKHVVKARHMLDVYSAAKSRDSYLAFEETFVVDAWSGFQITLMFIVGMLQVFMIKKLFKTPRICL